MRIFRRLRDEPLAGAITAAAIFVFVASGSRVANELATQGTVDGGAASALLLNIALILFSWSRHRDAKRAAAGKARAEQQAAALELSDPHTRLLNRRALFERGEAAVESADLAESRLGLLIVDLLRFGAINDALGHAMGDELLRRLSATLLASVPPHALCARLGGDEFAVLVELGDEPVRELTDLATTVSAALSAPHRLAGENVELTVAIGLSRLEPDCTSFGSLLRRADLALGAAKRERKPMAWFEAKMDRSARARSEVERGLRRGIPKGEFVPHYQPQIEFESGRIVGFEMLARWEHPEGGIVGPEAFIAVAEQAGLIGELSESLMRRAFVEARDWGRDIALSVNVSPVQLSDPWFPERLVKLLAETGFPAPRLDIEITESALFENLELAQTIVASLKNQGIGLTLDDFGTGYSSLAHLRALPFDRIKIDRSFVLSINKDPESWTIVNAVANLAASLGIPVTAEGIESAAVDLRVRRCRCDRGQGWFFGKAAPAREARRLLDEQRGGSATPADAGPRLVASV